MFRRTSPAAFLPKIEVSSARSRESLDTSCSSVAVGSCHIGGPFFFCRCAVWRGLEGLGGTRGAWSSSSMAWSRPSSSGSFLVAGRARGLSSSSSSSCMSGVWAGYAGFRFDMAKVTCLLGWRRSITRFSRRLMRETRQVQHNMSHHEILLYERKQAQSCTYNLVSLRIQFTSRTQISHLVKRKYKRYITCLKLINNGWTWWCCWKVNNATIPSKLLFLILRT